MWRLLIFIISIILLKRFFESLQKQYEQQQETPGEKSNNLFETLGFPVVEEIPAQPKPEQMPKKPVIASREIKKPKLEPIGLKPAKVEPLPKQTEEAKQKLPFRSPDKLKEGIILSAILGPPKAYQLRRGVGIGRRSGLKNR